MLRQALDAFVREDAELALQVCHQDDEVDELTDQLLRELLTFMMEDPHTITRALRLIFVSKYLERLADHATNIAEMVIFMVKGKSIRHLDRPPSTLVTDAAKKKILVVEDEPDIRELVRYNLEQAGFRVVEAEDGEAALRKVAQRAAGAGDARPHAAARATASSLPHPARRARDRAICRSSC